MSHSFRVTRLAVIDPVNNDGGGSRFVRALLTSLVKSRPDLDITFLCNPAAIRDPDTKAQLASAGIKLRGLRSVRMRSRDLLFTGSSRLIGLAQDHFAHRLRRLPSLISGDVARELEGLLSSVQVAYCAWPYALMPPKTSAARVCTIHDLNYRYYFGAPVWNASLSRLLESRLGAWTSGSSVVASSDFMAAEIRALFPGASSVSVVRVAPFTEEDALDPEADREARGYGRYVLCPTHGMVHKNIGPLIAAMAMLHDEFGDVRLVLTGNGTDTATGEATAIGSRRGGRAPNVVGLGYVSNTRIRALIANAAVVANPSLYEAGNGSGLDAWYLGAPVAMSDIEPFREHVRAQGVVAELFNPRDPADIAAKIGALLRDPGRARKATDASIRAIRASGWAATAEGYLTAFDEAYGRSAVTAR